MRGLMVALRLGVLLCVMPACAVAQSPASRLIERARAHMAGLDPDSAFSSMQQALDPSLNATPSERARGLTLLAVILLQREPPDPGGARQAFERLLKLDGEFELPDSIANLQSEARLVFAQARQIVPRPVAVVPLGIALTVPDTVSPLDGGVGINISATRPARVQIVVTPADSQRILWQDSVLADGPTRIAWPLRLRSGELMVDGRYTIRAFSTEVGSSSAQVVIALMRVRPDTVAAPAPPAVLPETAYSKRASPAVLVGGLALAGAAVFLPTAMGNPDLSASLESDARAYAVGGTIAIGTIVGWVTGRRQRAIPENILRNQQNQLAYTQHRDQVAQANARARATAGFRIQTEGARQ